MIALADLWPGLCIETDPRCEQIMVWVLARIFVSQSMRGYAAGLHTRPSVLQVEDIIDTGATLKAVIAKLRELGAASVKSAVLLNKEERRNVVIEPDYAALKARPVLLLQACGTND